MIAAPLFHLGCFQNDLFGTISLCETSPPEPLTGVELALERQLVKLQSDRPLYHGGVGGLVPGERLLPPHMTGSDPRGWSRISYRADHVHVSGSIDIAREYARNRITKGAVYLVEPVGPVRANPPWLRAMVYHSVRPDAPMRHLLAERGLAAWIYEIMPAFMCGAAEILAIVD